MMSRRVWAESLTLASAATTTASSTTTTAAAIVWPPAPEAIWHLAVFYFRVVVTLYLNKNSSAKLMRVLWILRNGFDCDENGREQTSFAENFT